MRHGWGGVGWGRVGGSQALLAGEGRVTSVGTHLERHPSLKAWMVMRVMFTDIKQKGNCWNGAGTGSVAI